MQLVNLLPLLVGVVLLIGLFSALISKADSVNLFRIFCGELMKTEGNEIFADKRSGLKKLIMISYLGWVYVALLTLFTGSGLLAVGCLVNTLAKD